MSKVLIISQGSAFLTSTLENNLTKEGIKVFSCEPDINEIDRNIEGSEIVLLFAGDYIKDEASLISYTVSKCAEEFIHFCVAGYPNELGEIEKMVDISLISAEFPRPFDMKDFVSKIRAIALGETAVGEVLNRPESSKHHILICDDDEMFLKMIKDWFTAKYRVTAVSKGLTAVTAAIKEHPELILLDFDMPEISGAQVMQIIRSEKSAANIPIVFLTGHSDRESVSNIMYLMPDGYMLKHQPKENIVSAVDRFFETKKWS